jgi:hypothetical protein
MTKINSREYADLKVCPQVLPANDPPSTHVSLGDLHGNALKLIYIMIEEGVLTLQDKAQYEQLQKIYYKDVNALTKSDLANFKEIIKQAKVNHTKAVTLIGDELADRGNNDYFTLLVLQQLKNEGVDLDIMLSNHSVEFIADYEKQDSLMDLGLTRSLHNMNVLLREKMIEKDEITDLVNTVYKPLVKAIGYTMTSEGDITIFSHAPIGLETIEELAKKYGTVYNADTSINLMISIDLINQKVTESFVENKLSGNILEQIVSIDTTKNIPKIYPLARLVWNRVVGDELITQPRGPFEVNFVHGHIGDGDTTKNNTKLETHQNLDSSFGKSNRLYRAGDYSYNIKNEYGQVVTKIYQHITRQSTEFTAKQLLHNQSINNNITILINGEKNCVKLLLEYEKHKIGKNDRHMNNFIQTKMAEIYTANTKEELTNIALELSKALDKMNEEDLSIKKIKEIIAGFRTNAGMFTVGMKAKADKIEAALANIKIEDRKNVHEGTSPEIKALHQALASHRYLGKPTIYLNKDGTINEDKAATAFKNFKKAMTDIKSSSSSDNIINKPQI